MAFCLTFEEHFFWIVFFFFFPRTLQMLFHSSGLYLWWEERGSLYHDVPVCDLSFSSFVDFRFFFTSFLIFSSLTITCLRVVFFLFLFIEVGLESLWYSSNLRKFSTTNSWKNILPHFLFSGPPFILCESPLMLSIQSFLFLSFLKVSDVHYSIFMFIDPTFRHT